MSWRVAVGQLARGRGSAGKWDLGGAAQDRWAGLLVAGTAERRFGANLWAAERKRERVSAGMRGTRPCFIGSEHLLTTFVMPGKGFNEVGSLFFISLLYFLSMLQYVLFTSSVVVLSPAV